ncbi:MAG TPA: CAP domain-containing protein [Actinomycetota bacterium]|nr:CAP domain-containing protein [Actinomycetota bacterium]
MNAKRLAPMVMVLGGIGWVLGHAVLPAVAQAAPAPPASCFVAAINSARAEAGLPGLATDPGVGATAAAHSTEMAAAGDIFHNPDLAHAMPRGWAEAGENVGMGPSCATVATALFRSPEHRANILDSTFSVVGVGVAEGRDGTVYVTEDFLGGPTPAS